jgi:beta-glucanase (GH16 family)
MLHRTTVVAVAVASFLLLGSGLGTRAAAQISDVPGWQLAWHDEFDGTSLDTGNWTALNRQDSYNNEKQFYLPDQVTVADGNLQITATNQPIANKNYRSGLITSQALFGPGRFEARIDLPTTQGMWPAFWLNPNQVQWPTGGEIDILENRGSQPYLTSSAYHWQTNPGPCCDQHQYVYHEYTATEDGNPVNFHTGFHTYAVEWDDSQLRFYVDDNLHFVVDGGPARPIFDTPKNIILNLAIGGDFGGDPNGSTVFPQQMIVDYVRYWQLQTGLQGDYNGDGIVDAEDYTVWRDSLGQSGIGLPADGSGNGTVDESDFQIWKENFGNTQVGAATSTEAVPEPATVVPMSVVGLMLMYLHRLGSVPISSRGCHGR